MENSQGNPEIGMTEDSFETAENSKAGSEAFFDALDNQVNGQVRDNDTEVTQNQQAPAPSAEAIDDGSNNVQVQSNDRTDWE